MISYAFIIFGGFFLINFLSNGFLLKFLRVKSSRGRKVLVLSRGRISFRYFVGKIIEGVLEFRDEASVIDGRESKKMLGVPSGCLFRAFGVVCVMVDEETNSVLRSDLKPMSGWDAVKWNNLLVRALKKPSLKDNSVLLIVVLILLIVVFFGLIALFVKVQGLESLLKNLATVRSVIN